MQVAAGEAKEDELLWPIVRPSILDIQNFASGGKFSNK